MDGIAILNVFFRTVCADENWDQFCIQRNTDTYGQPYDYDSIMHYADEAFTKRAGLKTMIPRKKGVHIWPGGPY